MRIITFLFLVFAHLSLLGQLDNKALLLHANEIVESEGQLEIISASEAIYSEKKADCHSQQGE